jgi:hypothetical protein
MENGVAVDAAPHEVRVDGNGEENGVGLKDDSSVERFLKTKSPSLPTTSARTSLAKA